MELVGKVMLQAWQKSILQTSERTHRTILQAHLCSIYPVLENSGGDNCLTKELTISMTIKYKITTLGVEIWKNGGVIY